MGSFLIQPTRRGYRMKSALILLVCLGTAHCFWITGLNRQDEGQMMPMEDGVDTEGQTPMEEGEEGKKPKGGKGGDMEEGEDKPEKGGKGGDMEEGDGEGKPSKGGKGEEDEEEMPPPM